MTASKEYALPHLVGNIDGTCTYRGCRQQATTTRVIYHGECLIEYCDHHHKIATDIFRGLEKTA